MSRRGEEILLLAAAGLTDKEIADELCISVRTVEGHWRRLREETGQPNKAGLLGQMLAQRLAQTEQNFTQQLAELEAKVAHAEREKAELRHRQELAEAEARLQSRVLHDSLTKLYDEVNRLRDANSGAEELRAIVLKSNVLAYRCELDEPHRCLFISESVRALGYRPSEFLQAGLPLSTLVHPEDFAEVWAKSLIQLREGAERLDRRYRLVSRNGDVRHVIDRCHVERPEGGPASISTFVFDITHMGSEIFTSNRPLIK